MHLKVVGDYSNLNIPLTCKGIHEEGLLNLLLVVTCLLGCGDGGGGNDINRFLGAVDPPEHQ